MAPAGSGNLTDGCGSDGSSGEGGLGEVLAGVAIAVVASVGINIGNNVQVPIAMPIALHQVSGWAGLAWDRGTGEGEGQLALSGLCLDRSAARPTRGLCLRAES